MIDYSEPNETSSLRRVININNNNSANKKMNNKQIIGKLSFDFVILLIVGLPILAFFLWGEPYKRGFFCDDESLMHPFKDSTIKNWMLYIIGLVLPIGMILATEIIQSKVNKQNSIKKYQIFEWDIPTWMTHSYKQVGVFVFGAACSQLTTDIAKYTIGRLRPHFFDVCQPIMPDGTNCSNPINFGKYIVDFKCGGFGTTRMIKEMRLSFPSGHSSFSAYTMIFFAIYLNSRMTWRGSKLLKHFLQYLFILMTWYTALSRISDYKHHWSDVLAGGVIGTTCAIIVAKYVADFHVKKNEPLIPQTTRYELGTSPTNGI